MSTRIPPDKIAEIKAAANAVEVISIYMPLKKRGSNYFGLSPFVDEKIPSFAVSPSKNIWKDFSTGKGGDALAFLIAARGMSEEEGLIALAQRYGIPLTLADLPDGAAPADNHPIQRPGNPWL